VRIPLPKLLRHWRDIAYERHLMPARARSALALWAFFAKRPALYRLASAAGARVLGWLGGERGRIASLPFASGWTRYRDLPAPEGESFQARWRRLRGGAA
jgi:L-lactate dehydrogenase complex protein LldF